MLSPKELHKRRKSRVRYQVERKSCGRLRLSVHRTGRHIYAQIINDVDGKTLVSASSMEKELRKSLKTGANKDAAKKIGQLVAERALKSGIKEVALDRSGYLYHGRIKELAEGAREGGLSF